MTSKNYVKMMSRKRCWFIVELLLFRYFDLLSINPQYQNDIVCPLGINTSSNEMKTKLNQLRRTQTYLDKITNILKHTYAKLTRICSNL